MPDAPARCRALLKETTPSGHGHSHRRVGERARGGGQRDPTLRLDRARGDRGQPEHHARCAEADQRPATTTTARAKTTTAPSETAPTASATPSWPLTIRSVPLGAELWVDGKKVGSTPARDLALSKGGHRLKLVTADGRSSEKTVRVSEHAPSRYIWRADADTWESGI